MSYYFVTLLITRLYIYPGLSTKVSYFIRHSRIYLHTSEFFLAITRVTESIFLINVTYSIYIPVTFIRNNKVSNKVPW
jgi:hypothetical protein